MQDFTTALAINLLYRLTLLHQRLQEKFFLSDFLTTLGKKEAFQDQKPCVKVYPMAYLIMFVEYAIIYPHHFHLPWQILSPKTQIYFEVEKLLRVLKFLTVLSVQSSLDSQMK